MIERQTYLLKDRILVWISCGAASACAAKLAVSKYPDRAQFIYCDTSADEHEDNPRFLRDVEQWIGRKITTIRNPEFRTTDEVFDAFRYMSGPDGARCTKELKRLPRTQMQHPVDVHIFGFTSDEQERIDDFEFDNPDLQVEWILRDNNVTKADCYRMIQEAGIALPAMYLLGYRNNNCKGCVKATSPGYWNKVRVDFPEVFQRRAAQSRRLGVRLVKFKGERIFLDELPEGVGKYKAEDLSCGPQCVRPLAHPTP